MVLNSDFFVVNRKDENKYYMTGTYLETIFKQGQGNKSGEGV